MKFFILTIVFLLAVCDSVYAANRYYCPSSDGSFYQMRNIYNPAEDCSDFNNDFFGKDTYKAGLAAIKAVKQQYLQGKCEPIIVKTHFIGTCKGQVVVAQKAKRVLEYHTSGGDCMDNLKLLYKDYEF